jgi:hypothetical protein
MASIKTTTQERDAMTTRKNEVTGRIEVWTREQITNKVFIIWGVIYGDTKGRWEDGTQFHTSGIRNRACKQGDIIKTRNSTYELGESLEDCINARLRDNEQ